MTSSKSPDPWNEYVGKFLYGQECWPSAACDLLVNARIKDVTITKVEMFGKSGVVVFDTIPPFKWKLRPKPEGELWGVQWPEVLDQICKHVLMYDN